MTSAFRFEFAPVLPLTICIGIGVACVLIWLFYAVRGGRAWLTRAVALTLLSAAIANPLLIQENREPLQSTLAVVVDRSASMQIDERTSLADDILARLEADIAEQDALSLRLIETRSEASETELLTSLTSTLSGTPRDQIAGVVMITDGQVHDLPRDLTSLEEFGPIHNLITGSEDEIDNRIEITAAPSYGIVGEETSLTIEVDADIPVLAARIQVNDAPATTFPVRPNEPLTVPVEIDRRGQNTVIVSIPVGENELTDINNIATKDIIGIRDTLRVLLITGMPHQGGRAWRDLLKSDPMVDLVHFTILRPPHKFDATPTEEMSLIPFPTEQLFDEKLEDFDLIIFDRYQRRNVLQLRYLDNIARYVDNGGALIVAAGEAFAGPFSLYRTPLASVLPLSPTGTVETTAFTPQLTDLGRKHSVTSSLNEDEFGEWYRYIEARKVTGDVVMSNEAGAPLLALDRVGDGRVAELMSDHLWLWARGHDGGGPFAELIRRIVHWAMKEPELEEEALTLSSNGDALIIEYTALAPTNDPLRLTAPTGLTQEITWQEETETGFRTVLEAPPFGLYRAEIDDLKALHLFGPAEPREFEDLKSTTDLLSPLDKITQGHTRRVSAAEDTPELRISSTPSGDNWIGVRDRKAYVVRDSETRPILPPWLVAGILFGLLLLAWRREGR